MADQFSYRRRAGGRRFKKNAGALTFEKSDAPAIGMDIGGTTSGLKAGEGKADVSRHVAVHAQELANFTHPPELVSCVQSYPIIGTFSVTPLVVLPRDWYWTAKLGASKQEKPQPFGLGFSKLVGPHGLEPWTKGFVTRRLSPLKQRNCCLFVRWTISSPSTSNAKRPAWSGVGRSWRLLRELDPSASLCTFRSCSPGLAQGCHACKSRTGRFP